MAHRLTLTAEDRAKPAETLRDTLEQFAGLMDTYASDQRAMRQRPITNAERKACAIRAEVYDGIAEELRGTIVEER